MLAPYKGFPERIHGKAVFQSNCSTATLAKTTLQAISDLNKESLETKNILFPIPSDCEVRFEWGVSYGESFVYLDAEETAKVKRFLDDTIPSILDFYFVILYHRVADSRKVPLRFDYGFLRVLFAGNNLGMLISHEKGPMRFPIEDFLSLLAGRINNKLLHSRRGKLHLKEIRSV